MKQIVPKHVAWLVAAAVVVAALIFAPRLVRERQSAAAVRRQQAREDAAAGQKAAPAAAAGRAAAVARYLNVNFARHRSMEVFGVAVAGEDGTLDRVVTDALVGRFEGEDVELIGSLFKPAFFSDGLFRATFAGSPDAVTELALTNYVDALLLGREEAGYSTNTFPRNVVSVSLRLNLIAAPLLGGNGEETWNFSAIGSGSNAPAARAMAEQRLVGQINNDTNMSLVQPSADNAYPFLD